MNTETFKGKLRASDRTRDLYGRNINQFLAWLDGKDPAPENAQEYIDYLEQKGRRPNTVAVALHAIRAYFKVVKKPVELSGPKVTIGEPSYLTTEEVYKLLDAATTPLEKCLVTVLFDTGCRIAEVLNSELQDIDWEGGFLTVTRKGGRRADVNISGKGLDALKAWLDARKGKHQRVFLDLAYYDAWQALRKVAERAGIENFTPHRLRHSRAVHMLSAGADLHDVQMALGHQSIRTTADIYGRLRPADLKKRIPDW